MSNDLRKGRHCVFKMHVHLVFVSKYRKNIFTNDILKTLNFIFSQVCTDFESKLIEFEGEKDHVHLLVRYPPKVAVSKLVNSLKGVSSRLLKKEHGKYIEKFYWKNTLWSPSYFAGSCGGAPIEIIREYIENQDKPKE